MSLSLPHGWFDIPGIQIGSRTLEEQSMALKPALEECSGKTVADFGCAEGLISIEFAKAGAASVYACDYNSRMIDVARMVKNNVGTPAKHVNFYYKNFERLIHEETNSGEIWSYNIVLALGVLHKLKEPEAGVKFVAQCCNDLLLVRSGRGAVNRVIRSKHFGHMTCDMVPILTAAGFTLEKVVPGPEGRGEDVDYWRKTKEQRTSV